MWEIPEIPPNITDDKARNRKRSLSLIVTEALADLEKCDCARFPVDVYESSDGYLGYVAAGLDGPPWCLGFIHYKRKGEKHDERGSSRRPEGGCRAR